MNNFDIFDDQDRSRKVYHIKKLWLAVVMQAFHDIINGTKKEARAARYWLLSPLHAEDRKKVMELAGMDEAQVQRLARKFVERYQ